MAAERHGIEKMHNYVFRRREQKYLLTAAQNQALEALMVQHMKPEKYWKSDIRNIYFDTPDRRMIRHSLEKPIYKEKLRLRCYGPADNRKEVFLELKKKYKGIVYKRRISMALEDAVAYMADPEQKLDAGQIGREIDYVKKFYPGLQPAMYLSYDRLAWKCPGSDLRITVDRNIRFRTDPLDLTVPPSGEQLLEPGQYLMEVKTAGAMPLWLTAFLSQQQIRKTSFSKYGKAHMLQVQRELEERRGVHYA